jgi:hypothetical protein
MYQVCYYLDKQTEIQAELWQTGLYHAEGKQTQEIVNPVRCNITYSGGIPSQEEDPLSAVLIQS